ncbi:MAG: hypothetical protein WCC53_13320 [Thermoanaerobaculia bacterium]
MKLFRTVVVLTVAAHAAAAQAPAVSGLSPTPAPPAATSEEATPVPTPAPKLTGVAGPAVEKGHGGQSLADIVRLSKEARKGQPPRKSLGTITNETLSRKAGAAPETNPPKGAATATRTPKTSAAGARGGEPTPAPTYDVPRDDKGRSESDWRAIVGRTRAAVLDGEARVRDLDTKAKQLENDFYAQSDGFRRDGVIKPAWDKTRDDLARARADLEAARKALDDLAEEARRTNAPPGWLR